MSNNERDIMDMKDHMFKTPPNKVHFSVHVACHAKDTVLAKVLGRLHRISPAEPVHALLCGIYDARDAGRDVLDKWEAVLLSIPYVFELVENHQMIIKRSINMREDMVSMFEACMRTALALSLIHI